MTRGEIEVVRGFAIAIGIVVAAVLIAYGLIILGHLILPASAPETPYCDPGTYWTGASDGGPKCLPYPPGVRP